MPYAEHRRSLVHAAMASMALHALVLSLNAPALKELLAQPFPSSAAIVARLVEPAAALEAPAPESTRAAAPKREATRPVPKRLVPAIDPPPTAAAAEDAGSPVANAAPARPAIDATSVAQYRHQLISSAVRHKRYPDSAVSNDWQGDVLVSLNIAASGAVAAIQVKASSGHALLDEQTLDMFRRAAAEVPVPPALRGQEFGVEVRASYELRR